MREVARGKVFGGGREAGEGLGNGVCKQKRDNAGKQGGYSYYCKVPRQCGADKVHKRLFQDAHIEDSNDGAVYIADRFVCSEIPVGYHECAVEPRLAFCNNVVVYSRGNARAYGSLTAVVEHVGGDAYVVLEDRDRAHRLGMIELGLIDDVVYLVNKSEIAVDDLAAIQHASDHAICIEERHRAFHSKCTGELGLVRRMRHGRLLEFDARAREHFAAHGGKLRAVYGACTAVAVTRECTANDVASHRIFYGPFHHEEVVESELRFQPRRIVHGGNEVKSPLHLGDLAVVHHPRRLEIVLGLVLRAVDDVEPYAVILEQPADGPEHNNYQEKRKYEAGADAHATHGLRLVFWRCFFPQKKQHSRIHEQY